jgi:hypothetical protein
MARQLTAQVLIELRPINAGTRWVYRDAQFQQPPLEPDWIAPILYPSNADWDELCKEFVSLDMKDTAEVLAFLNKTGEWAQGATSLWPANLQQEQAEIAGIMVEEEKKKKKKKKKWGSTRRDELLQSVLDDFYSPNYGPEDEPPDESGWERAPIYIDHIQVPGRKRPGGLEIGVGDTRSALYLTLWLQKVRDAKFRYCKRGDCPVHAPGKKPFSVSRSDQVYCSQYCAHLESLRKKRAELPGRRQRNQRRKGK